MNMWTDIAVENAGELKDFYSQVFGWTVQEVPMEDEAGAYADYAMVDKKGEGVGGVCHKRGVNNDLPSQWIVYFTTFSKNGRAFLYQWKNVLCGGIFRGISLCL